MKTLYYAVIIVTLMHTAFCYASPAYKMEKQCETETQEEAKKGEDEGYGSIRQLVNQLKKEDLNEMVRPTRPKTIPGELNRIILQVCYNSPPENGTACWETLRVTQSILTICEQSIEPNNCRSDAIAYSTLWRHKHYSRVFIGYLRTCIARDILAFDYTTGFGYDDMSSMYMTALHEAVVPIPPSPQPRSTGLFLSLLRQKSPSSLSSSFVIPELTRPTKTDAYNWIVFLALTSQSSETGGTRILAFLNECIALSRYECNSLELRRVRALVLHAFQQSDLACKDWMEIVQHSHSPTLLLEAVVARSTHCI